MVSSGVGWSQGVITLPRTGQTKCYDTVGTEIACTGTGQDGEYQAGVAWPNPRFTPSIGAESDCMIDNLTGLMWPENGNLPGTTLTWNDAIDYANNLTLCGHSDWQLPNINELKTMVNADTPNAAIWLNTQGFINVQGAYWSSTTRAAYTDIAFVILMDSILENRHKATDYQSVWPVRAASTPPAQVWKTGQMVSYRPGDDGDIRRGVGWPEPRFSVSGDCVTDNLTGLMWPRNANLLGGNLTWEGALEYANNLTLCDYTDWRLPNWMEFMSLIDQSQYDPALPAGHPFTNVQPGRYWSSTSDPLNTAALCAVMWQGLTLGNLKGNVFPNDSWVWPVRGGQVGPPPVQEIISTPNFLSGPTNGTIEASYTYSTGGSSSNLGHSLQYFFDWGDGTNSGWLPVGTTSASKSWSSAGSYTVKAQARCSTDTSVVSGWSPGLTVTISASAETVSTPSTPSGPSSGITNTSYTYSTEVLHPTSVTAFNISLTGETGPTRVGSPWGQRVPPNPGTHLVVTR